MSDASTTSVVSLSRKRSAALCASRRVNPFGYRNSYKLVAVVLTVVLALIVILFREAPKGQERVKAPLHKKRKVRGAGNNPMVGMTVAVAVAIEEACK